jgi:hypothetical protein
VTSGQSRPCPSQHSDLKALLQEGKRRPQAAAARHISSAEEANFAVIVALD